MVDLSLLAGGPLDDVMRRAPSALGACSRGALVAAAGEDIYQGHLYVFLSRRRDRAKILTFQKGGFVLWYKWLERGRFRTVAASATGQVALDATELAMLLDGIDVARVQRARHWRPKKRSEGIDSIAAL